MGLSPWPVKSELNPVSVRMELNCRTSSWCWRIGWCREKTQNIYLVRSIMCVSKDRKFFFFLGRNLFRYCLYASVCQKLFQVLRGYLKPDWILLGCRLLYHTVPILDTHTHRRNRCICQLLVLSNKGVRTPLL